MEFKFTRSARKHRIGYARALAAIANAGEAEIRPAPSPDLSESYRWVGDDGRGVELEVIAVPRPDCLLVIHVMPTACRQRRT